MYTRHPQSFKDEVLAAIKNGTKILEICAQHNLSTKTVYAWLRKQADNTGTSNLEIAKLRRENQEGVTWWVNAYTAVASILAALLIKKLTTAAWKIDKNSVVSLVVN